jgi:hypothetical protein
MGQSTLFFSQQYRHGPTQQIDGKRRKVYPRLPEQPPLRTEEHPGLAHWMPPYAVPHEGLPLSARPESIQGVPTHPGRRAGVHSVEVDEVYSVPPVAFAFLLSRVWQTGKQGYSARALIAQVAPGKSIGRIQT